MPPMPPTIVLSRLGAGSLLSALLSVTSAGCAAGPQSPPSALQPISLAPVTAPSSYIGHSPTEPADQLPAITRVVRRAIRRFNQRAQHRADQVRIFTLIPHVDTATAADVFVALERRHNKDLPLLDRVFQLRFERGRWLITSVLPT